MRGEPRGADERFGVGVALARRRSRRLCAAVCHVRISVLSDSRAVGDRMFEREKHDLGSRRHSAKDEHLAVETRDASRAEIHRGDDLPTDELLRRVVHRELRARSLLAQLGTEVDARA